MENYIYKFASGWSVFGRQQDGRPLPEDRSALATKAIRAVMLRAADRSEESMRNSMFLLVCPPLVFVLSFYAGIRIEKWRYAVNGQEGSHWYSYGRRAPDG